MIVKSEPPAPNPQLLAAQTHRRGQDNQDLLAISVFRPGSLSAHEDWPLHSLRISSDSTILLPGTRIQNLENNLFLLSFLPTLFSMYS